jgi:hypothetical protein
MAGQVYKQIQKLIVEGGKNDPMTISYIRTKLMLKGIDPDKWGPTSEDNQEILVVIERFSQALVGRRK